MSLKNNYQIIEKLYLTNINSVIQKFDDQSEQEKQSRLDRLQQAIEQIKQGMGFIKGELRNQKNENAKQDVERHLKQYELYLNELEGFLFQKSLEKEENQLIINAIEQNDQQISQLVQQEELLGDVQVENQFNQEAIKEGDELYRQAFQKLKDIKSQLAEKREMLDRISDEIVQQNYWLQRLAKDISESKNPLKQFNKTLDFFSKVVQKKKYIVYTQIFLFIGSLIEVGLIMYKKFAG